jgi:cellulose synthase/poly-beta-1,6-N-acetylglucosamine synthase-like glycosyltransferase
MIVYLAWFLIGATIFLSTFYLSIYWNREQKNSYSELDQKPSISILMPAYNEEDMVEKSIESALELDYLNYKILFIDDGSTDCTLEKARKYKDNSNFKLLEHEENQGKAAALNTGLEASKSKYVAVQDADSRVESDLVEKAVAQLEHNPGTGAVIGSIKSFEHDSIIQRIQRIQYRLTNFYRSLMAEIGTLDVTPGAFSIYRASDIRDIGGFDVGNPTEDLEMAWKLREKGKDLGMVFGEYSSTHYPERFRDLYGQRVRWKRGSIYNSFKYKHMFFDRQYGRFGTLQLPIHVITPLLAAASLAMVLFGVFEGLYNFAVSFSAVGWTMPRFSFDLVRMFLGLQLKIYVPLLIGLGLTAYIIKMAYSEAGEDVRHPGALAIYYLGYFAFEAVFVMAAILKELFRTKRIWT